jgi:hypothetical protein
MDAVMKRFALGRQDRGFGCPGRPERYIAEHIVHCSDVAPTVTSSGPPYSRTGNERVEAEALAVTVTSTAAINAKTDAGAFMSEKKIHLSASTRLMDLTRLAHKVERQS